MVSWLRWRVLILIHSSCGGISFIADLAFGAGTSLQGSVLVQVRRRIERFDLSVVVCGEEQTSVPFSTSRVIRDVHPFFITRESLCTSDQTVLEPGMHTFPFSIELPDSLPSSVGRGRSHNGCLVQYTMFAASLRTRTYRYFRVKGAALPNVVVPSFIEPRTEIVKSAGWRRLGSITYGVSLSNTQLPKGDSVEVTVACRNNSAVEIENVTIKLVELYTWKAMRETSKSKRMLLTVKDLDLPGIETEKLSWTEVHRQQRPGSDAHLASCEVINRNLRCSENAVRVPVPCASKDSLTGKNMEVSHYIKVEFVMKGKFSSTISTKIPVRIGRPADSSDRRLRERIVFIDSDDVDVPIPFVDAIPVKGDALSDGTDPQRGSAEGAVDVALLSAHDPRNVESTVDDNEIVPISVVATET